MARTFDGSLSNKLTGSSPWPGYPLTMACWFKANNVTDAGTLISYGDSSGTEFSRIAAMGNVSGDPIRITDTESSGSADTTTGFSANAWHHACGVFANNASRSVYLDGAGKGSDTGTVGFVADVVSVGVLERGSPAQAMNGAIAWPAVWSAELSDAEVAVLAAGAHPLTVRPGDLVELWEMHSDGSAVALISGGTTLAESGTVGVADDEPLVSLGWPINVTRTAAGGGGATVPRYPFGHPFRGPFAGPIGV